jgi:hypothetical protein
VTSGQDMTAGPGRTRKGQQARLDRGPVVEDQVVVENSAVTSARPAVARDPRSGEVLSPLDELNLTLTTAATFRDATQHADAKANMVTAIHAGVGAVVATQVQGLVHAGGHAPGPLSLALRTCAVVFPVVFLLSGFHLVRAIRPRTMSPPGCNRFAFPSMSRAGAQPQAGSTIEEISAEAWAQSKLLATVAATKNRHVDRAIIWTSATVMAAVIWLGLACMA